MRTRLLSTTDRERMTEELAVYVSTFNSHVHPCRKVWAMQRIRELRKRLASSGDAAAQIEAEDES